MTERLYFMPWSGPIETVGSLEEGLRRLGVPEADIPAAVAAHALWVRRMTESSNARWN